MSTLVDSPSLAPSPLCNSPYYFDGGFPNHILEVKQKAETYADSKKAWLLTSKIVGIAAKIMKYTAITTMILGAAVFLMTFSATPLIVVGLGGLLLISYAAYRVLAQSNQKKIEAYECWRNIAFETCTPTQWNWFKTLENLEKLRKLGEERALSIFGTQEVDQQSGKELYETLRVTALTNLMLQDFYTLSELYLRDPEKYSRQLTSYDETKKEKDRTDRDPPPGTASYYYNQIRLKAITIQKLIQNDSVTLNFSNSEENQSLQTLKDLTTFFCQNKKDVRGMCSYLAALAGGTDLKNKSGDDDASVPIMTSKTRLEAHLLVESLKAHGFLGANETTLDD